MKWGWGGAGCPEHLLIHPRWRAPWVDNDRVTATMAEAFWFFVMADVRTEDRTPAKETAAPPHSDVGRSYRRYGGYRLEFQGLRHWVLVQKAPGRAETKETGLNNRA